MAPRRRPIARIAAAGVLLVAFPTAAAASVRIAGIDTSAYPRIRVSVISSTVLSQPPSLTEDGKPVVGFTATSLADAKSILLAVDRSQSMYGRSLADAVAAARAFVAGKPPADRIAIQTFASRAQLLSSFSADPSSADAALRTIKVDTHYGTTLNDAIVQASTALRNDKATARVIILVTDGQETTSKASLDDAIQAARKANVVVYPVAIQSTAFSPARLRKLARDTGGTYYAAAQSSALRGIYAAIGNVLRRTWRLEYATAARPGDHLQLRVAAAGGNATTGLRLAGTSGNSSGSGWSATTLLLALAALAVFAILAVPWALRALGDRRA